MDKVLFTQGKSDEWSTPLDVFNKLNDEFNFTLDPCAQKDRHLCKKTMKCLTTDLFKIGVERRCSAIHRILNSLHGSRNAMMKVVNRTLQLSC